MNSKTHVGSLAKGATPGRGSSWSPGSRLELVPRAGDGGENPGSGRGRGGQRVMRRGTKPRRERVSHQKPEREGGAPAHSHCGPRKRPPGIPARAPHLLSTKAERSRFLPEKQKRNVRESPSEEKRQPMEIRNYSKERRGRSGNHRRKRINLSLVMRPSLT